MINTLNLSKNILERRQVLTDFYKEFSENLERGTISGRKDFYDLAELPSAVEALFEIK